MQTSQQQYNFNKETSRKVFGLKFIDKAILLSASIILLIISVTVSLFMVTGALLLTPLIKWWFKRQGIAIKPHNAQPKDFIDAEYKVIHNP
jgi:hypothetical protein